MLFFWAVFDGIVSYVTPLLIEHKGFTNSQLGLIISTSSVAGAIFDLFISKYIRATHYLRLLIIVFAVCLAYPLLLWTANSVGLFIFAMTAWGLYFDLVNFSVFDFAARNSSPTEHSKNMGIISIFRSLGYFVAPIVASYFIADRITSFSILPFPYMFLLTSIVFYIILFSLTTHTHGLKHADVSHIKPVHWLQEFRLWVRIGHILLPVLFFSVLLYLNEATFWTIGPIFSEEFTSFDNFGGFFMALHTLPVLIVDWFAESFTRRFGKKRTAFYSMFLGSLFLILIGSFTNPFIILALVFLSSVFNSLAFPAIEGAYVDYITEASSYESEIVGLTDFSTNVGYILGPALSGIVSDLVGVGPTFMYLGIITAVSVIILTVVTPKSIKVVVGKN